MGFWGCLAIGIWYWVCQSDLSKVLIVPGDTYWMGLIIGLFFGDPAKGFMVAATIELAYMGVVGVGGTLPSDKKLAALIAIPLTLQLNLDLGAALAVAIPFGMLGGVITNTGYALCSFTHEIMVRHVKEKKYGLLYFDAYGYPLLVKFPLAVIPVTAILWLTLSGNNAEVVLSYIPDWLNNSLVLLGQVLPAVGLISCVRVIGTRKLLPWFVIGFFICKVITGISTLTFAILGTCVAVLIVSGMSSEQIKETASATTSTEEA